MSVINSSDFSANSNPDSTFLLDHPAIGIPDHPLQYRAIGVIQGIYEPSQNALTKGIITTADNQIFHTVLLGKAIGAVKNHVDLDQVQNWVVYPHTIPDTDNIHFQIAGIYQPQTNIPDILPDNYFSIRGDIAYSSKYKEKVIVKINQGQSRQKPNYFKLELKGKIPNNQIRHFFTFSVCLEGKILRIKKYLDLGLIGFNYR
ncbi:2-dehydropantoate 2-reductase [Cyanobacterium sp. Dongsha4]|uniref:2-dehydropantoate 2-reductase n=1 Tax=Cyanobacterium sp. DS4 TaxID=2878255 RepID=UPI002E80ADA1|nr:2-dehydropantoate 2-reductase [Cyanobacterium sp. Dongsha4]WVL02093.1 2-dehydropantoate 2-reductase [Cyanobacterium sp. Dongsha4]